MIILKNVLKKYQNFTIFQDLNLEIPKNHFTIIYGESGSGKSTLLNILTNQTPIDAGEYLYEGFNLKKESEQISFLKNEIGIIYQNINLMNNLSIIDNVLLPISIRRKIQKNDYENATKLLKKIGLENNLKTKVKDLSGGQKQRVAIARALINSPKILFCDEPTGSLDYENAQIIMKILNDLYLEGISIVLVTHDETLKHYGTQIIYLSDGNVIKNDIKKIKEFKEKTYLYEKSKYDFSYKYSLKNFFKKKIRNSLIVFTIAISLSVLLLISIINANFQSYKNTRLSSSQNQNIINGFLKDNNIDELKKLVGDGEIQKIKFSTIKSNDKSRPEYMKDDTISSFIDGEMDNKVIGRIPEKENEILIVANYNSYLFSKLHSQTQSITDEYLEKNKPFINEKVTLNNKEYTITGIVKLETLGGYNSAFLIHDKYFSNQFIQENDSRYRVITNKPQEFLKKIISFDRNDPLFLTYDVRAADFSFANVLNLLSTAITLFSSVILLISFILISELQYISIYERRQEFAILKNLGTSKKQFKKIVTLECLYFMIFAFLQAIIYISLIFIFIKNYLKNNLGTPEEIKNIFNFNFSILFIALFIITCIFVLISLIVSKKVLKLDFVKVLKED